MGSVQSLNPKADLGHFFDYMYGDQEGYVYSPTKDPDSNAFHQEFFHWPTQKDLLIEYVIAKSPLREVYYSPSLFNAPSGEKEAFKGSYFVWCEFDGNAPDTLSGLPSPSLKIQSSLSRNQHWYWKLDHFETDRAILEDVCQRLAYDAEADLACWNANRVLRPPGTTHHESSRTVTVLKLDPNPQPLAIFSHLKELPFKLIAEEDIKSVPAALDVIASYKWTDEDFGLFKAKIEKGERSSALTKLGHVCMEMGMTNGETLSILTNADDRWKKFSTRQDQRKWLIGVINHCRAKHPVDVVATAETIDPLRVYTFHEFMEAEVSIEWVLPGLVHKKGFVVLSGPPNVGKSQLSIRFAEKLARGEKILKWTPDKPRKIVVFSMEMPYEELRHIMDQMNISKDELLRENFLIIPVGSSVRLHDKKNQAAINKIMDVYQPDGVMFDSLGVAISGDLNSDSVVLDTFDYVHRTLRGYYGAFVWFLHHNRKAQIGNKKPNKLEDLYGSQYIGAAARTGIGLWPNGVDNIDVNCLKLSMAPQFQPFSMRRVPGIDFVVAENHLEDTSIPLGARGPSTGFGPKSLGDTI